MAAIRGLIDAIAGHATSEQILAARPHAAAGEHLGEREDHVREGGIGHRHVHLAAVAAAARVEQGDQDAHHGPHGATEQVADLQVRQRRRAAGAADLVEHARIAEVVDVVAGTQRVRPGLPVAADAAQHHARIAGCEGGVTEAEALHDPGAKALDHHVRGLHEAQEKSAPLVVLEIQTQAALVAVDQLIEPARIAPHGTHGARVIAGTGVLHLDHLGAVVSQVLGGERTGKQPCEVENAHAGERCACGSVRCGIHLRVHRVAGRRQYASARRGSPRPGYA